MGQPRGKKITIAEAVDIVYECQWLCEQGEFESQKKLTWKNAAMALNMSPGLLSEFKHYIIKAAEYGFDFESNKDTNI